MNITKEALLARLKDLQAGVDEIEKTILQLEANKTATEGAIQDVEYWLGILDKETENA